MLKVTMYESIYQPPDSNLHELSANQPATVLRGWPLVFILEIAISTFIIAIFLSIIALDFSTKGWDGALRTFRTDPLWVSLIVTLVIPASLISGIGTIVQLLRKQRNFRYWFYMMATLSMLRVSGMIMLVAVEAIHFPQQNVLVNINWPTFLPLTALPLLITLIELAFVLRSNQLKQISAVKR